MKLHVEVRSIGKVQVFKNTTFIKQELFAFSKESNTPYKFEFKNKTTELLKDVLIGSELIVEFNIRGNVFDKKDSKGAVIGKDIANSLDAYKITIL